MTDRTPAEVIAELRRLCAIADGASLDELGKQAVACEAIWLQRAALLALAEAAVAVDAVWRDGTRIELDWALETLNDALSDLTRKP